MNEKYKGENIWASMFLFLGPVWFLLSFLPSCKIINARPHTRVKPGESSTKLYTSSALKDTCNADLLEQVIYSINLIYIASPHLPLFLLFSIALPSRGLFVPYLGSRTPPRSSLHLIFRNNQVHEQLTRNEPWRTTEGRRELQWWSPAITIIYSVVITSEITDKVSHPQRIVLRQWSWK